MENNLVVRYKNAINRAAHFLDVIEQRIILSAIAQVPAGEVTDDELYCVSASDLVELGSNQTKVYGQMKDAVCSPAGTTIVGVSTLEKNGFRFAVIDAVDQIENKVNGKL